MADPEGEGAPRARLAGVAGASALLAGLVLAHLEVLSRGPGYAGPLLVLDHLFALLLAATLLGLAAATGRKVLALADLEPPGPLDSLLFASAVGAGAVAVLLLLAGLPGFVSPLYQAGILGALAVAVRRELGGLPSLARRAAAEVRRRTGDPWLLGLAGAAAAGAALFLFVHGAAPPGDWDSLMYHLEIPRAWVGEGRIHLPEDNLHAAYTGLVHLLYLPLLAAGSASAPALLNGLFALLLAAATFAVGARLLDGEGGALAGALVWASTGFLIVATTARVDTTLTFFLLLGHGSAAAALLEPDRAKEHLLRAGLVLGLALGIKYHALAYTAALAPVGLWALRDAGDDLRGRARLGGLVAGIFAVAALPWLVKNVVLVGAPFYPFFTERILPPWLAGLYGSAAYPAGVDPGTLRPLAQARETFDLVAFFLAPERLTVEPEGVHYNVNPFLLLLPLWLLRIRSRAVAALAVPAILYALMVVIPFPALNLRYLLPPLVPLTLVAAYLAGDLLRGRVPGGLRRGVLVGLAALALVPTVRSGWAWTTRAPVLEHAAGRASAEEYLASGFGFYAALAGVVNREVPRDGKVLLLWEARSYYLAPPTLQDNVLTNWRLLLPYLERSGGCLEGTGITHVLVSTGAVRYYTGRGTDPAVFAWDRLRRFAGRCLDPVEEGPGFVLYARARERP